MACIEASEYTTGTILGVHSTLEECEEQCGVCCIPSCDNTFPASFNIQYATGSSGSGSTLCQSAGRIERQVSTSPITPPFCDPITSIPWKPGYPGILGSNYRFIFVGTEYYIGQEGVLPPGPCCSYLESENCTPGGSGDSRLYFYKEEFKQQLYSCISGVLVNITEEALDVENFKADLGGFGFPPIKWPINALENEITYGFSRNTVSLARRDAYCANEGVYPGNTIGAECWSASPHFGVQERPSLPEEGSASGVIYTCNDTITQSGCLFGGVLNPSGTALGAWITGQTCETFDCNA
jgi:hypothetical protein